MTRVRNFIATARGAFDGWSNDKVMLLSAGLSYFTLFSLAPLLLIAISISGLVLGEEASKGEIFHSINGLIGPTGAAGIQSMVKGAGESRSDSWWAAGLGI